jgi:hypothetical protein
MNKKAALLIVGLCSLQLDASVCPAPYPASNEPSQAHKDKQAAYHRALRFLPFPPELAEVVVAYRMVHVIQNKNEFYECLYDCADDCNEVESIKEYIDQDPKPRIAWRYKGDKNPLKNSWKQYFVNEKTPLMVALCHNTYNNKHARSNLLRLILSYPQDLDAREDGFHQRTALRMAARSDAPLEHLFLLVEYGVQFSTKSQRLDLIPNTSRIVKKWCTAEENAREDGYRNQILKSYVYLKCARELDEHLALTMPDLLTRRKIVADELRRIDKAMQTIGQYWYAYAISGPDGSLFDELWSFLVPMQKTSTGNFAKRVKADASVAKKKQSWLKKLFCC